MDVDGQAASAEKALQELRASLQVSAKGKGKQAELVKQIAASERLAQRLKNAINSYRLEMRSLPLEEQAGHVSKIAMFEEGLKQCRAQIDWKRLDAESHTAGASKSFANPDMDDGPVTMEQAVAIAERTQGESAASLGRSMGMVLQAEQVGIAALERMHAQEEQLNRIGEDVEDIKANIARSRKLLGQIARSAAGDRCIQMLCVLITICVMVMISLAIAGKNGTSLNVTDSIKQATTR